MGNVLSEHLTTLRLKKKNRGNRIQVTVITRSYLVNRGALYDTPLEHLTK